MKILEPEEQILVSANVVHPTCSRPPLWLNRNASVALFLLSLLSSCWQMAFAKPSPGPSLQVAQSGKANYVRTDSLLKSGRAMLDRGRWDIAQDLFSKYCKEKPVDPEGYFWQGVALDESGDPAAAVEAYNTAIERAENLGLASAEIWTNLGNVLLKTGKLDDAIEAFKKASTIDPELVPARLNLARASIEKGECQAALEALNRCSDLHFNGTQLSYYRAKALLKLGRPEEAAVQVDKLLTQLPDGDLKNGVKEEFKAVLKR